MLFASIVMYFLGARVMDTLDTKDKNKIKGLSQNFSPRK